MRTVVMGSSGDGCEWRHGHIATMIRKVCMQRALIVMMPCLLFVGALIAVSTRRHVVVSESAEEPLFEGLGDFHRTITTSSALAQRYCDQGILFLYAFNQDEASRSFEAAARQDPNCAMALWGVAMANGRTINGPQSDDNHPQIAWRAITTARALAVDASPVEAALINAASTRYAEFPGDDRGAFDEAYASAMRQVWRDYPDDADVGALTAEAILDLRPWDQWQPDGTPQPGTEEAIATLEKVLAKRPQHPFALHLLIHAVEASAQPERGRTAANKLRELSPGLEHLLHVPSHIDIRLGDWRAAVVANEKAIAADDSYCKIVAVRDDHRFWVAHDHHMLAYAATMRGEESKATHAINRMTAALSEGYIRKHCNLIDAYFAMPYEVMLRFGKWERMLAEPPPREYLPIAVAMWHYARGIAYAARNELREAKQEQRTFVDEEKVIFENSESQRHARSYILPVAEKMLEGEILFREGKIEQAIAALRESVRREDSLPYQEPTFWMLHVRQALGAVLLVVSRLEEAESVYRSDLRRHPENGWSLWGLARAVEKRGHATEAAIVRSRFESIWRDADIRLCSSCYCIPCRE
jgi:tetratricopeptide (TPR) repeat protein